eukprot:TRINITY_DN2188_c0_g1_i1.p1 TRINITY_DN2188_c0_g1~~TRINITY_DN2188_c0_g1_i1.p1  ORF type:complete len:414 (+),score=80.27 TRINITY_DN2188_c0_g1_i1:43-1284(+)
MTAPQQQGPTIKQLKISQELVRMVARAFYNDDCIVVMDALTRQTNIIKDEDLANLLKLHHKQVRKTLSQLQSDRLIRSESRHEPKSTGGNSQQHMFWYIDYKQFIDVVKYRLCMMHRLIERELGQEKNMQFTCESCQIRYSALESINLLDKKTGQLHCGKCSGELTDTSHDGGDRNHVQRSQLTEQLRPISEQLKLTENLPLPIINRAAISLNLEQPTSESNASTAASHNQSGSKPGQPKTSATTPAPPAGPDVFVKIVSHGDSSTPLGSVDSAKPKDDKQVPSWLESTFKEKASATSEPEETPVQAAEEQPDAEIYRKYCQQFMEEYARQQQQNVLQAEIEKSVGGQAQVEPVETSSLSISSDTVGADEETTTFKGKLVPISQLTDDDLGEMNEEEYREYFEKANANKQLMW